MQATSVIRIEENVDRAASALFAAACSYAAYMWLAGHVLQPTLAGETLAAAAFAYVLARCSLGALQPQSRRPPMQVFDVRAIESVPLPELLLTDRYEEPKPVTDDSLLLDDILAALAPDSRVVRLFDPAAMPTPAQLKSRVDEHLDGGARPGQPPDGVQALHQALDELRRSLR